jgi:hypothetical protein
MNPRKNTADPRIVAASSRRFVQHTQAIGAATRIGIVDACTILVQFMPIVDRPDSPARGLRRPDVAGYGSPPEADESGRVAGSSGVYSPNCRR